jgi:D-alanyl-lipoteichoic acid acyltransferase DltB (MBOAT superfamily)
MLFNSYQYIFIFLPASLVLFFLLSSRGRTKAAKVSLVLSSLFFYGWWDPRYLPLILGSILFNYTVGRTLSHFGQKPERWRKRLLAAGIAGDVLLLGYFKYADFFVANVNTAAGLHLPLLQVVLPLGISFFTFTQIAYLVDAFRGRAREYSITNYALFVSFFPHLLAGPILHHREMMPQFDDEGNKRIDYGNLSAGIYLFFIGLVKKVVIADSLAPWANSGFDTAQSLAFVEAWITSLSYTLQLYFDFSGYTDMALGSARMFNIRLPLNFNSPYRSLDIREFWRRWHMTLSRFLRDYLYIPLGGNRGSEGRVTANLLGTFLIGGLWHGAGWTFVFWGFLHGAAMGVHRLWSRTGLTMPKWLAWLVTFHFVNVAWVFFRARSWDRAWLVLKGMCGLNGVVVSDHLRGPLGFLADWGVRFGPWITLPGGTRAIWMVLGFGLFCLVLRNSNEMAERFRPAPATFWFLVALSLAGLFQLAKVSEFLYFNF